VFEWICASGLRFPEKKAGGSFDIKLTTCCLKNVCGLGERWLIRLGSGAKGAVQAEID
jgi:hypothetical protein